MPWVEQADDEEFLTFVRNFRSESRPQIMELLKQYEDKHIVVFKSREEAEQYF